MAETEEKEEKPIIIALTVKELSIITGKIDSIDANIQEIEELNAKIYKKNTIQLGNSIAITLPNEIVQDLKLLSKKSVYWVQIDKDKLFLYIKNK